MSRGKAELRGEARARRRALWRAGRGAAERAAANLPPDVLAGIGAASLYSPMRDELDCGPLVRRLGQAGVRILLPVVVGPAQPLEFREWTKAPLVPDGAGVLAPPPAAASARPDLVVVPLLAWDARGHRLGYGGGYYDRTLAALRAEGPVLAVGLAFEGQRMDDLPHEPHDQKLDAILTEIGYSRFPDRNR
jgi:5-formyltetrahydrofolate cyclo-ligase